MQPTKFPNRQPPNSVAVAVPMKLSEVATKKTEDEILAILNQLHASMASLHDRVLSLQSHVERLSDDFDKQAKHKQSRGEETGLPGF